MDYAWAVYLQWRVGRKIGRTIYAQIHSEPSDEDIPIGMMDSAVLAEEAVLHHNKHWKEVRRGTEQT